MALITMVNAMGRVTGTSLTGRLNETGGYPLAFYLAAASAGLAILIMLLAKERRRPPCRPSLGGITRLATRRDVLLPSLLSAVHQYVNWATNYGFMTILAEQLGANGKVISILASQYIVLQVFFKPRGGPHRRALQSPPAGLFQLHLRLRRHDPGRTGPSPVGAFCRSTLFFGVAMGISYPILMGLSIERVTEEERTTAMGLHQSVYAVGMFLGTWLGGEVASHIGIRRMFIVTAFVCLARARPGARWLGAEKGSQVARPV